MIDTYDARNRLLTQTDATGGETQYAMTGRQSHQRDHLCHETDTTFDAQWVTSITDVEWHNQLQL